VQYAIASMNYFFNPGRLTCWCWAGGGGRGGPPGRPPGSSAAIAAETPPSAAPSASDSDGVAVLDSDCENARCMFAGAGSTLHTRNPTVLIVRRSCWGESEKPLRNGELPCTAWGCVVRVEVGLGSR